MVLRSLQELARRQIVLGGYRLGDFLRLVASKALKTTSSPRLPSIRGLRALAFQALGAHNSAPAGEYGGLELAPPHGLALLHQDATEGQGSQLSQRHEIRAESRVELGMTAWRMRKKHQKASKAGVDGISSPSENQQRLRRSRYTQPTPLSKKMLASTM